MINMGFWTERYGVDEKDLHCLEWLFLIVVIFGWLDCIGKAGFCIMMYSGCCEGGWTAGLHCL